MKVLLSSKFYRELDHWKTKAVDYKAQLKDLIDKYQLLKETSSKKEKEYNELIKEVQLKHEAVIQKEKEVDERLKEPELKASKAQKMVLLEFLGVLALIDGLDILQGDKVKLLAYIVTANEKNIEKDFNGRGYHLDSRLSNLTNYNFLVRIFKELGMKEQEEKAQGMLNKIKNKSKKA